MSKRSSAGAASMVAAIGAVLLLLVTVTATQDSHSVHKIKNLEEVPEAVNYIRKVAFAIPPAYARTQQLVSTATAEEVTPESAAEEARCVGLLHACQTWLQLKDGEKNSIVITDPNNEKKELVSHEIVLPDSGSAIPDKTWGVMQEACKYGLADLKPCDKPRHWPRCSGVECHKDEHATKVAKQKD